MKTYLDCLPCFVRQSIDAVRTVTDDVEYQHKALHQLFEELAKINLDKSPPVMGQKIHRIVRDVTGKNDLYVEIKKKCNELGREIYPKAKRIVAASENPFETAVRLAIAGNIIDFGTRSNFTDDDLHAAIDRSLKWDLGDSPMQFEKAIACANRILYIGDNTGEIFFDRILIEQMPKEKVTFSVRGKPILNDALMADAEYAGITELVRVIDNGDDSPGAVLERCSESFREEFEKADLIISKGQGNYETLSETDANIFFILKAKCKVIAEHIGCEVDTPLLISNQ